MYSAEVHLALEIGVNGDHFVQLVQIELGRHATSGATAVRADRAQVRVIVEDGLHVVARTEGDQVSVVSGRRDRDRTRTTNISVTQLISQHL